MTLANAFRVEQNELTKATTAHTYAEGVVAGETGAYNDQVYKNKSNDMDYGYVAEGNCVDAVNPVSYTHLRAHETVLDLVCRLLLEKKKHTTINYA